MDVCLNRSDAGQASGGYGFGRWPANPVLVCKGADGRQNVLFRLGDTGNLECVVCCCE